MPRVIALLRVVHSLRNIGITRFPTTARSCLQNTIELGLFVRTTKWLVKIPRTVSPVTTTERILFSNELLYSRTIIRSNFTVKTSNKWLSINIVSFYATSPPYLKTQVVERSHSAPVTQRFVTVHVRLSIVKTKVLFVLFLRI